MRMVAPTRRQLRQLEYDFISIVILPSGLVVNRQGLQVDPLSPIETGLPMRLYIISRPTMRERQFQKHDNFDPQVYQRDEMLSLSVLLAVRQPQDYNNKHINLKNSS
jgi:hypothetical protein